MGKVTFFISEAIRALRRSAAPSIAAVTTILVTTMLLGVLIPVLRASEAKTTDVRDQIGLRVFLHKDATQAETAKLGEEIEALPHVTSAEFVSEKEAVQVLQGRLEGDLKGEISQLERNPLPPSFDVSLDDADSIGAVRTALQPVGPDGKPKAISPLIEDVNDAREESNQIREVTGAVKIVLIVIAALLAIASLLLVANTIRLSIYARRREVEVMRLVGATNWFIRWPFMIEGVLVGLFGATLAVGILWLGKVTIVDPLAESFALVDNFSTVGFAPLVIVLISAAVVVSAMGSGITLRRFLKV
jgi:cell division transport system permease protein